MKNQFVGDIGDYTKLGLLRTLDANGFSIGINWYLTENNQQVYDGLFTEYLSQDNFSVPDHELFYTLKKLVETNQRDINVLEQQNLFKNALFFNQYLSVEKRLQWHNNAIKVLNGRDIIFLDPDIGIEVKSINPNFDNGNKYVTYQEAIDYFRQGANVIIYNHRDHREHGNYMQKFHRFSTLLGDDVKFFYIRARRFAIRDYIFLVHSHQADKIKSVLSEMVNTSWKTYMDLI